MTNTEEKVSVLWKTTRSTYLNQLLNETVDSYTYIFLEHAKELQITCDNVFEEIMHSLFDEVLKLIAPECERILAGNTETETEADRRLMIDFCAFIFSMEKLHKPSVYLKQLASLIAERFEDDQKRALTHRIAWFIDDVYDDTWEALEHFDNVIHQINQVG